MQLRLGGYIRRGQDLFESKYWTSHRSIPVIRDTVSHKTELHRLQENIGAAEIILHAEDLKEINEAVSKIEVQGARYSAQAQKMIDR